MRALDRKHTEMMSSDVSGKDEDAMTLQEYLEQERNLEQEALQAYPGKFDECTYSRGSIRQRLYVCRSCLQDPAEGVAAICYSCAVACHPTCELIELYARRENRCDCGNTLFKETSPCQLCPFKEPLNDFNAYRSRQNFFGKFCRCHATYDPFNETREMFQCLICEDWFHDTCIDLECRKETPSTETEFDFICKDCVRKHLALSNLVLKDKIGFSSDCKHYQPHDFFSKCRDLFLTEGWRNGLCDCDYCRLALEQDKLGFLYFEAPIFEPESDIDENTSSTVRDISYECLWLIYTRLLICLLAAMKLLEDRVNRSDAIKGIQALATLKTKLMDFLKPIAQENRTVTKAVCVFSIIDFILICHPSTTVGY